MKSAEELFAEGQGAERRGLLLFAHGARDPRWAEPFQRVAAKLAALEPNAEVALAFLEFMTPDLRGAGDALVAAGCERVDVVPLFLGTGGHVRRDLPALLDALVQAHPAVRWQLQGAIGEVDSVIDAMARAAAAMASGPSNAAPQALAGGRNP